MQPLLRVVMQLITNNSNSNNLPALYVDLHVLIKRQRQQLLLIKRKDKSIIKDLLRKKPVATPVCLFRCLQKHSFC
jgi:hypothetical protein